MACSIRRISVPASRIPVPTVMGTAPTTAATRHRSATRPPRPLRPRRVLASFVEGAIWQGIQSGPQNDHRAPLLLVVIVDPVFCEIGVDQAAGNADLAGQARKFSW